MKEVKLKTADEVEIVADYYSISNKNAQAVVFLHMLPATKESWNSFAKKFNEAGFQCLAIDLRGHGQSEEGPEGSKDFTDEQHQSSINDVDAAVEFFVLKGVPLKKIILVGASIGANLSLWFQSKNSEIKASVLLSPGLSYKGIDTEPFIKKLSEDQCVFFSAGGENDDYSTETVQKLSERVKEENTKVEIFRNAGHGTTILKEHPELMDEIINWLKDLK